MLSGMRPSAPPVRRHARLAVTAPIVIALLGQAALVAAVLFVARSSDQALQARQTALVETYLAGTFRDETNLTLDNGLWDDLVTALREPRDDTWLAEHIARNLTDYSLQKATVLLDVADRPIWAAVDGERADPDWYRTGCPRCEEVVAETRRRLADPDNGFAAFDLGAAKLIDRPLMTAPFPLVGEFVRDGDRVLLVKAAPVAAEHPADRQPPPYPVLLNVVDIGEAYVPYMQREIGIAGVRLLPPSAVADGVTIRATADGTPIATLTWDHSTPAMDLVLRLAPYGLLFMLLFTGLVAALSRRLRAMLIDQQAGELLGGFLATHDPLTGVGNRAYLAAALEQAFAAEKPELALVMVDLDGFKAVNDTHGHAAGDDLIRAFAGRLVAAMPPAARIVRLGGDEFAVVLPATAMDLAERIGAEILELARRPFPVGAIEARVGASVGIARVPEHAADGGELLRAADVALYRSKGAGRNRVTVYVPPDDRPDDDRGRIARKPPKVPDPAGLTVEYRPVFALDELVPRPVGVAADLRCLLPDGRSLPAGGRALGDAGAGNAGAALLRIACREVAGQPDRLLIAPVDSDELLEADFHDRLMMLLDGCDLPAHRLMIEIPEGSRIVPGLSLARRLERLRSAGVGLSLAGFGGGQTDLARLRALPLDRVRLSSLLLRGLDAAPGRDDLLSALVAHATVHRVAVAAGGVESERQLAILRGAGCRYAEGPALGGPVPLKAAAPALNAAA